MFCWFEIFLTKFIWFLIEWIDPIFLKYAFGLNNEMFLVASPSIGFDDAGVFFLKFTCYMHEFMCLKHAYKMGWFLFLNKDHILGIY